jgi:hypothetical protein
MANLNRFVFVCSILGIMSEAARPGAVFAADYNAAIDRAIAERKAKGMGDQGPIDPPSVPADVRRRAACDERTWGDVSRPIARALAHELGKPAAGPLRRRLRDAPDLILMTLDELGDPDLVAQAVVYLMTDPQSNYVINAPFCASMCSPASRQAVALALALVKVPPRPPANEGPSFALSAYPFVVLVGDERVARALDQAAADPKRAVWSKSYRRAASIIRERESLPPAARAVRAKDELLLWQACVDVSPGRVLPPFYEMSARTLAAEGHKISTEYLLKELLTPREAVIDYPNVGNPASEIDHALSWYPHPLVVMDILAIQGDPASVHAVEEFAKKNPDYYPDDVAKAIASLKANSGKRNATNGTPSSPSASGGPTQRE